MINDLRKALHDQVNRARTARGHGAVKFKGSGDGSSSGPAGTTGTAAMSEAADEPEAQGGEQPSPMADDWKTRFAAGDDPGDWVDHAARQEEEDKLLRPLAAGEVTQCSGCGASMKKAYCCTQVVRAAPGIEEGPEMRYCEVCSAYSRARVVDDREPVEDDIASLYAQRRSDDRWSDWDYSRELNRRRRRAGLSKVPAWKQWGQIPTEAQKEAFYGGSAARFATYTHKAVPGLPPWYRGATHSDSAAVHWERKPGLNRLVMEAAPFSINASGEALKRQIARSMGVKVGDLASHEDLVRGWRIW